MPHFINSTIFEVCEKPTGHQPSCGLSQTVLLFLLIFMLTIARLRCLFMQWALVFKEIDTFSPFGSNG